MNDTANIAITYYYWYLEFLIILFFFSCNSIMMMMMMMMQWLCREWSRWRASAWSAHWSRSRSRHTRPSSSSTDKWMLRTSYIVHCTSKHIDSTCNRKAIIKVKWLFRTSYAWFLITIVLLKYYIVYHILYSIPQFNYDDCWILCVNAHYICHNRNVYTYWNIYITLY